MRFRQIFYIAFLTFISAVTTEWICIEEILGQQNVEINAEENIELESSKKTKEKQGSEYLPLLFNPPGLFASAFDLHLFLHYEIRAEQEDSITDQYVPYFIRFCQLKIFS